MMVTSYIFIDAQIVIHFQPKTHSRDYQSILPAGLGHCGYRRYYSSQGRCIAADLLCTGGGMLSL